MFCRIFKHFHVNRTFLYVSRRFKIHSINWEKHLTYSKLRILLFIYGLLIVFLSLTSCLETYFPEFSSDDVNTLVISGSISDQEGYNYIYVTKATNLEIPRYTFINGCTGFVSDEFGNHYPFENAGEGKYKCWINKDNLIPGIKFKLFVKTPGGIEYESDEEAMPNPTTIDSIYARWVLVQTGDPKIPKRGLQFFANLHGPNSNSTYYRFVVEETWEYHSPYPIYWYYNGALRHYSQVDFSHMVCYSTASLSAIYTLSTSDLAENKYNGYPLHFIENNSEKLLYRYSVLVKQYGNTAEAYRYLNELRKNIEEQGGLYEKQPLRVNGNMHCLTNPEKKVIGYFMANSISTKRISFSQIENLNVDLSDYCVPWIPKPDGVLRYLKNVSPYLYPVYVLNESVLSLADQTCFDCMQRGGSLTKPDFLP
jgi:hypothetical protein